MSDFIHRLPQLNRHPQFLTTPKTLPFVCLYFCFLFFRSFDRNEKERKCENEIIGKSFPIQFLGNVFAIEVLCVMRVCVGHLKVWPLSVHKSFGVMKIKLFLSSLVSPHQFHFRGATKIMWKSLRSLAFSSLYLWKSKLKLCEECHWLSDDVKLKTIRIWRENRSYLVCRTVSTDVSTSYQRRTKRSQYIFMANTCGIFNFGLLSPNLRSR